MLKKGDKLKAVLLDDLCNGEACFKEDAKKMIGKIFTVKEVVLDGPLGMVSLEERPAEWEEFFFTSAFEKVEEVKP